MTPETANILEAFATRIEHGEQPVQVDYGLLNPNASWRTRLMTIALTAFHIVRSRGREMSASLLRGSICLDLALDLLVLPLSCVELTKVLQVLFATTRLLIRQNLQTLLWLGISNLLIIALYFGRSWQRGGTCLEGLKDLARARGYLFRKVLLTARRQKPAGWIRTDREAQ